jgi:hypothetical protein
LKNFTAEHAKHAKFLVLSTEQQTNLGVLGVLGG